MSASFEGKTILVTGAGRGIGKRLAIAFAGLGARIGLMARTRGELDLARLEIEHNGGSAIVLRTDIRDAEQVNAMVDRARVHFGPVSGLIHAAGVTGPIGPLLDAPAEQWRETLDTMLTGVFNATRAVLPEMISRREGKIIVLTGNGAGHARPNFSAYASAQAGIVRLVETLAAEVEQANVQVNAMFPGKSYTAMVDEILRAGEVAGENELAEAETLRQTGGESPEKQIDLAAFLASVRSNHINGRLLSVHDDWRKLEKHAPSADLFTLRRVKRV
jgi:NAD(P)-dependent dehydrogenase (short-subunit alcohol dehydrogenase family)